MAIESFSESAGQRHAGIRERVSGFHDEHVRGGRLGSQRILHVIVDGQFRVRADQAVEEAQVRTNPKAKSPRRRLRRLAGTAARQWGRPGPRAGRNGHPGVPQVVRRGQEFAVSREMPRALS